MRSKWKTRSTALLLISLLMLPLAACNTAKPAETTPANATITLTATETPTAQPTVAPKEPVTVRVLVYGTGEAGWNDYADGDVQQEIKKATGATLEVVEADQDKFNVLLAGGDLPDIVRTPSKYFTQLIEGNNVIALDDLLQSNGKKILQNIPDTLAFSRKNWSNGQGKVYFIPVQVQNIETNAGFKATIGPSIRWDYYKELGYPEIKSEDDLLNVLSQIVQKHPKTEEGKNIYGLSMFNDWGLWFLGMGPYFLTGGISYYSFMTADNTTDHLINYFEGADAPLWKCIGFYYKANQMGLLDPDALTMKFGDYSAKELAGQIVFTPAVWCSDFTNQNAKDGKGFMVLPLNWGYQYTDAGAPDLMGWYDKSMSISKSCKMPDRAMDLLDYLYSYEGCRMYYSGISGKHWSMVNGKPALTADTVQMWKDAGDPWKNTGMQSDNNLIGLGGAVIDNTDNQPLNLFNTPDVYVTMLNNVDKDFCEHYGVAYPGEIFDKIASEGKVQNFTKQNKLIGPMLEPIPDDMAKIEAKLSELVTKYMAKCILSKSDDEYKANMDAALAEFKSAGLDQLTQFYSTAFEAAKTKAENWAK